MRFDSVEFWAFFAVVLVLHRLLPFRRGLLVLASYAFYASWNPPFLLLLLYSSVLDYAVALRLGALPVPGVTGSDGDTVESAKAVAALRRKRRALLAVSLVGNLGVLVYFKYVGFLLDNLVALGALGVATADGLRIDVTLPLGISFYTFQTLSYTIDVYRGDTKPVRSFGDFLLFVAFFPQLIAGPILRAADFIPQIARARLPDQRAVLEGVELCLVGLFQKVVIADGFANVVDRVFAEPEHFSGSALLVASFCFNCQIYCDFAGYSTMAVGLARLLATRSPRTSTSRCWPPTPSSTAGAGTSPWGRGSATTSTSRWAATGEASGAPRSTPCSPGWRSACGTGPAGRSCCGARSTASCWWPTAS